LTAPSFDAEKYVIQQVKRSYHILPGWSVFERILEEGEEPGTGEFLVVKPLEAWCAGFVEAVVARMIHCDPTDLTATRLLFWFDG